jgi:ergothioneine biosynthesis protein EgtB
MQDRTSLAPTPAGHPAVAAAADAARRGGARVLGDALVASRRDTLGTHAAYERALPSLQVPLRAELNPPLWELGHVGWFQEYWIGRNRLRAEGHRADPLAPRAPPLRADADALYNSSEVPHDTRWSLPLPDAAATRAELATQLAQSLRCLAELGDSADDDALYFYRLALGHEDMHHEAALYMAQSLGITVEDARWQPQPLPEPAAELAFDAAPWLLGDERPQGFVFDNEVGRCPVQTGAYRIDSQVRRWADFLPFVEAGGYTERRFWSEEGWAWREAVRAEAPRYLRRAASNAASNAAPSAAPSAASGPASSVGFEQWRHGRWLPLDVREAACHLTHHEALAWCRWAGRRLPAEAEWERAALTRPEAFRWGAVWEWTASPFAPFEGFHPHPYRDYSAPWFDGRPVLRGASFMTQPRMKHPRYRNYFQPHRNDVPAGLRSCAL